MTCFRTDEAGRCDCGGRDDGSCFEEPLPQNTGRLMGGLSRSIRKFRTEVTATDTFYTVLAALVGGGMGVLFAAMWVR